MKLSKDELIKKAKKAIIEESLSNFTDLIDCGISNYSIYKKHKLHEVRELADLIEENHKKHKGLFKRDNEDKIPGYVERACKLLDQIQEIVTDKGKKDIHYINFHITTNHSLAIALMILPDEWRDLELNKNSDIKIRLLRNKNYVYKTALIKLFNNTDTTAAITQIKLTGTGDDRIKLSTTYQQIESDTENVIKIVFK